MLADGLNKVYNRIRGGLLLRGLVALALGILILVRPMDSVAAFALVIAIWAIVSGVSQIVDGVEMREVLPHWWLLLLTGLVSAGFGVAALYYYPGLSLTFAVVWAAWWLLVVGFLTIYAAVQERRLGMSWGWTLTFGIIGVLAGIYAIASPPTTLAVIMGLIAGFAIVSGIVALIGFFKLTSAKEQLTNAASGTTSGTTARA
jgi:uncharacterized membrane protein HdeD (DUF308 family)